MEIVQNVLITGATGYIGKHLTRRLVNDNGYHVTILVRDHSNMDLIRSIQDRISIHIYKSNYDSIDELFRNCKFDYVFHLAAISCYEHKPEDISDMIDSNLKLGTFILEAMKKYGSSYFINTSTYWQNYQNQNYEPTCLYASTKKAFEDIIDYYCMDQKIKAVSLKLYDVYGYDDHRNKLLNNLLIKKSDSPVNLTGAEQKLYMVFIDDVIDAYQVAMTMVQKDNKKHAIYGVYGKEKYSLRDVIDLAQKLANVNFNITFGAKNYNQFQIMNSFGVDKLPGWDAKITLKEGLETMLDSI